MLLMLSYPLDCMACMLGNAITRTSERENGEAYSIPDLLWSVWYWASGDVTFRMEWQDHARIMKAGRRTLLDLSFIIQSMPIGK